MLIIGIIKWTSDLHAFLLTPPGIFCCTIGVCTVDNGVYVFKKKNYIWVLAKILVRNHKLAKGVGTLPMYDIQVWRGHCLNNLYTSNILKLHCKKSNQVGTNLCFDTPLCLTAWGKWLFAKWLPAVCSRNPIIRSTGDYADIPSRLPIQYMY